MHIKCHSFNTVFMSTNVDITVVLLKSLTGNDVWLHGISIQMEKQNKKQSLMKRKSEYILSVAFFF